MLYNTHTLNKMTHGIPQFTITNSDYGEVLHSTILKIFGDELTYNELEFYTRDKNATSYLEVKEERNNHEGFMFISVFVDKQKIMEAKYDVNWSCDMFNYLSELENEKEEEEDYCGEAGSLNYLFGIPVKKFVVSDEVSDDEEDEEDEDEKRPHCFICYNMNMKINVNCLTCDKIYCKSHSYCILGDDDMPYCSRDCFLKNN